MPITLRNQNTAIPSEGPPGGAPFTSEPADTTADVTTDQFLNLGAPVRKARSSALYSNLSTRPNSLGATKDELRAQIRRETRLIRAIYSNLQINVYFLHAFKTENSPVWENREANIELLSKVIDYQIEATNTAAKRIELLYQKLRVFPRV